MKLNFYEDLEQMEYIRKFNENKNKNKKQWRNIMIDELNWNCSIERMICYFIGANRCITDDKKKYLAKYIREE